MSEEKELFEWVEIPHEYAATKSPRWEYLPSSGSWVHTDKGYNWFYQGVFYTDTFYGTRVYPKEWLKPIPQSSLKKDSKIVVWKDGTYKVTEGQTWEYENDGNWLTTIKI